MVLKVDDIAYKFAKVHCIDILNLPYLVKKANDFDEIPKAEIVNNKYLLYINQSEMASIDCSDRNKSIKYIGTDDMTTCFFVVLICSDYNVMTAAHLDGTDTEYFIETSVDTFLKKRHSISSHNETNNSNISILKSKKADKIKIDVFMVGGFVDDSYYSEQLVNCLFTAMNNSEHDFNLQLAKLYISNNYVDKGYNYPKHYGCLYNFEKHQLGPASIIVPAREPRFILRSARFCSDSNMVSIYNAESNCLEIQPFDYKAKNRQKYYKALAKSSDFLLRRFSTSPRQEKSGFEKNIRKIFTLMSEHPEPLVTVFNSSNLPIRYECDSETGKWKRID